MRIKQNHFSNNVKTFTAYSHMNISTLFFHSGSGMLLMMLEIWSSEFEDLEFINYRTGP